MKKDLFILAGPTAVGKTQISIKLAKKLQGEIISADSMQIYKHMDIGSAKVKEEEKQGIPHYLIDIISPNEEFSVSEFTKRAKILIDEVSSKKKLPMIVGGTGLYINSLIFNYNFAETSRDENYRNYLNALAQEKGKEYVHNLLKEVDKESSEKLYPNDLKRVIRALEVYKVTGKTIGELNLEADIYEIPYNVHYYVLCMNREELYERINMRVDMMLQEGLLNEVKALMEMGLNSSMQSMKGIGYKELLEHLEGKISLEEAIYLIKKGSRNYAKRQLTWFRKDKRVNWIDKEQFTNDDDIVNYIVKDFEEKKYKEIIVSN